MEKKPRWSEGALERLRIVRESTTYEELDPAALSAAVMGKTRAEYVRGLHSRG